MKYKRIILVICSVFLCSELGLSQPEAVLSCSEGFGYPGCDICDIFVQIKVSQLDKNVTGFQILLKYDTSALSVSTIHRPYLLQSFDLFLWHQREDGLAIIAALGTIKKNTDGPIVNVFFRAKESAFGDYNLIFDVQETILACGFSDPLELEIVNGSIWIGYWDQWNYLITPRWLDFGKVELNQNKTLAVNVSTADWYSYPVKDITSDHPHFSVSPTSFTVDPGKSKSFFITFTPSYIGTTSALITVNPGHTFFADNFIIAVGVGITNSVGIEFESQIQDSNPNNFQLYQNWPNPFNPKTDIRYQIADSRLSVHTTLRIFNVIGQEVRTLVDEVQESGTYSVTWDGRNNSGGIVPNGLYFYQLRVDGYIQTKKCLFLK